jgi:hypothetical protein
MFESKLNKGKANGYASLGVNGKIPTTQIDTSSLFSGASLSVDHLQVGLDSSNTLNSGRLNVYGGSQFGSNLIMGTGTSDNYLGTVIKNFSNSYTASCDIILINDIGDENVNYIDMGINSSTYTGLTGDYSLGASNDAYLYSLANDFYIGNATSGKKLVFFNGGFNTNTYSKIQVHDQGTIVINGDEYNESSPEILRLNSSSNNSYNLITAFNNINNYSQINLNNANTGSGASSDFVATADNGNETTFYVDMGVNNSGYINNGNGVGHANDAYMYSTANDLYIGNASVGKKLILFNGGLDTTTYAKFYLHEDGAITINTSYKDPNNPAAIRVLNGNASTSMIHADGDIDDFSEINNVNSNNGTSSSSDIVATNNQGNNSNNDTGYIDMGINSSTYNLIDNIGGANDAYLYSTGRYLYVGNANLNNDSYLYFFVGGKSDDAIAMTISPTKYVGINNRYPEYELDLSGSARITNNLVVQGTFKPKSIYEQFTIITGITSTTIYDFTLGNVFYHSTSVLTGWSSNWEINLINVPDEDLVLNIVLMLKQGAIPYIPNSFKLNSVSQSIQWINSILISGNANSTDIVTFTIMNVGGDITILGQLTTFA